MKGPKFKTYTIQKTQKLIGSKITLTKGDVVFETEPEDEGYLSVKTKEGVEGQIPKSCVGEFNDSHIHPNLSISY